MQNNCQKISLKIGKAVSITQRGKPAAVRFREKYLIADNNCWLWQGAKDKDGYGIFQKSKRNPVRAHRYAFEQSGRALSPKVQVCHSCDVPSCVNPDHLWSGDNQTNQEDCAKKGRCGSQKLCVEDVLEIRSMAVNGATHWSLSQQFGVSWGYISHIVHRRKWGHID